MRAFAGSKTPLHHRPPYLPLRVLQGICPLTLIFVRRVTGGRVKRMKARVPGHLAHVQSAIPFGASPYISMPPTPFIPIIEGSETFISLTAPLAIYDKIRLLNIGVRIPVYSHLFEFFSPLGEFFPAPKSTSLSHLIGQPA